MENKQTAVDLLIKRCNDSLEKEPIDCTQQEVGYSKALVHFIILLKEAKQMEKEQIIDAYNYGYLDYQILAHDNAEEYYEQNFGH